MRFLTLFQRQSLSRHAWMATIIFLWLTSAPAMDASEIIENYRSYQTNFRRSKIEVYQHLERNLHGRNVEEYVEAVINNADDKYHVVEKLWGFCMGNRKIFPKEFARTRSNLYNGSQAYMYGHSPSHKSTTWYFFDPSTIKQRNMHSMMADAPMRGYFNSEYQDIVAALEQNQVSAAIDQDNPDVVVLSSGRDDFSVTVSFDIKRGYNIVWAELKETVRSGAGLERSFTYRNVELVQVNDLWIPAEAIYDSRRHYGNGMIDDAFHTIKRTKIEIDPDFSSYHAFEPYEVIDGALVEHYALPDSFRWDKQKMNLELIESMVSNHAKSETMKNNAATSIKEP